MKLFIPKQGIGGAWRAMRAKQEVMVKKFWMGY